MRNIFILCACVLAALPFSIKTEHAEAADSLADQIKAAEEAVKALQELLERSSTSSSPGACPSITANLWIGVNDATTGGSVTRLQRHLQATGDYTYPEITGYFGPVTEAAVKRWQARNGIVSSGNAATTGYGVVGPQTRAALASCEGTTNNDEGSTTSTVTGLSLTRNLSIGMSGADVRQLQEFLRESGDYTYPEITGYFGPVTEAAVKRWQARNGIVSSGNAATTGYGVVGPKTRAALLSAGPSRSGSSASSGGGGSSGRNGGSDGGGSSNNDDDDPSSASGCLDVHDQPLSDIAALDSTSNIEDYLDGLFSSTPSCITLAASGLSNADHADYLQAAADISAHTNKWLELSGTFHIDATITLASDTKVRSTSGDRAIIRPSRSLGSIFKVADGAEKVQISDLVLEEGSGVSQAMIDVGSESKNVTVSTIDFMGNGYAGSEATAGVRAARDWVDELNILDSYFEDLEYGVHVSVNSYGLDINRNEFVGGTHYAIRVAPGNQSSGSRSTDVRITGNEMHDPKVGPIRGMILVTRGVLRPYITNVSISDNIIEGPEVPWTGNVNTTATPDMIMLHGADGFTVADNEVFGGGENGITVSRMSRNGTISRNDLHDNDGYGLDIGSGYYEITVDKPSAFDVGDHIEGATSGTYATVEAIIGNVLTLTGVGGGAIFRNESVHNTSSGAVDAATISVVDRTKNIKVLDNEIYDNAVNGADELNSNQIHEAIVINSDSIEFRRNDFYSTRYGTTGHNSINLNNSRNILIDDSNTFDKGAKTAAQAVNKNSASWLTGEM